MNYNYDLESYEVRNLDEVLRNYLNGRKIKSVEYKKLPQAGYGSVMIKMTIALSDGNTLNAVAKVLPPNEEVREIFQIVKTYNNELHFYKTLVPILNGLRKESGLEPLSAITEFLGGRTTLEENGGNSIDDNAVLVLENLLVKDYHNKSPGSLFNLDDSEFLLRDLAELHGTAVALKLKKPKLFDEQFMGKYQQYVFLEDKGPQVFQPMIRRILLANEKCRPFVEHKTSIWDSNGIPEATEPYGTITHNDLWINNTMQQTVDGKVVGNKIVDFQLLSYGSAAADVFFFIWTSVEVDVIKSKLDHLLKYYHENLLKTIKSLGCDISVFTYDKFLDEIKRNCEYEFGHSAIFALERRELFRHVERRKKTGVEKFSLEDTEKHLSQDIKEFYCFMLLECVRRGWLQ